MWNLLCQYNNIYTSLHKYLKKKKKKHKPITEEKKKTVPIVVTVPPGTVARQTDKKEGLTKPKCTVQSTIAA